MRTPWALLAANGGVAALLLAGLGYRAWTVACGPGAKVRPTHPGAAGRARSWMPQGGRCGRRSWPPVRVIPSRGCSKLGTAPSPCSPTGPALLGRSTRSEARCTWDWVRRSRTSRWRPARSASQPRSCPTEGTLTLSPADIVAAAARILLAPTSASADFRLFRTIPNRHTNRGPYRADQTIAADTLRRLGGLVASDVVRLVFIEDRQARSELGALIVQATERIIGDAQMSADNARWFRTGRRDIAAHRDGVPVDTAGVSPLLSAVSKILPDLDRASADRHWPSMTRGTQVPSAPVLGCCWSATGSTWALAIPAGRAWRRLHLAATVEGLAAQPLNQPVECIDLDAMRGRADSFGADVAKLAQAPGWQPTFMFRLGVPECPAGPSPRRRFEEIWRT